MKIQRRGAGGGDCKGSIVPLRDADVRRLRRNGGRHKHDQRGGAAGRTADGVGDGHRIIRRICGRNFGQRERGRRRAGNDTAVFQPLICQRRGAGGRHGESNIAACENGGADGRGGDGRRNRHGERGRRAGDCAERVGNRDGITGGISGGRGGNGQCRGGRTGNVAAIRQRRAVFEPLIKERCGASGGHSECGVGTGDDRDTRWRRGDGRRGNDRERRDGTRDAAREIGDDHRKVSGVRRRQGGDRQVAGINTGVFRSVRDGRAVFEPEIIERRGTGGRHRKIRAAADGLRLRRGRSCDDRRRNYRERRRRAGDGADGVADQHGIISRIRRADASERERGGVRAGNIARIGERRTILRPIICQRRGATGSDGERGIFSGNDIRSSRLPGDGRSRGRNRSADGDGDSLRKLRIAGADAGDARLVSSRRGGCASNDTTDGCSSVNPRCGERQSGRHGDSGALAVRQQRGTYGASSQHKVIIGSSSVTAANRNRNIVVECRSHRAAESAGCGEHRRCPGNRIHRTHHRARADAPAQNHGEGGTGGRIRDERSRQRQHLQQGRKNNSGSVKVEKHKSAKLRHDQHFVIQAGNAG